MPLSGGNETHTDRSQPTGGNPRASRASEPGVRF